MEIVQLAFVAIAFGLGFMVFRLAMGNGWHWSVGIFLALIPVGFALFLGIIGLLIGALFVGGVYKASG